MGVCGKCPARLGGQSRRGASRPARPSPGGADPGPEPRSPSARRPRARPLSPILLFGLLLLTSALAGQRPGTRAESTLSSKLQLGSNKEQNGESPPAPSPARFPRRIVHPGGMHPARAGTDASARVRRHRLSEVQRSLQLRERPPWLQPGGVSVSAGAPGEGTFGEPWGTSVPACLARTRCQSSKFKNCL